MKRFNMIVTVMLAVLMVALPMFAIPANAATSNSAYYNELISLGFTDSYATRLEELHEMHPTWVFEPVLVTELNPTFTYTYITNSENKKVGDTYYNLVTTSTWAPSPWTSLGNKNYSPYYDTSVTTLFDSGWRKASLAAVKYFMDPRNFLNDVDIFMFETLEFNAATQTVERVAAALEGSFMGNGAKCDNGKTYAQYIWEVGKENNISPVFLASRLRQEQGSGTSPLVNGTIGTKLYSYYTNKPNTDNGDPVWGTVKKTDTYTKAYLKGFDGYYNFFNIGACGTGRFAIFLNGGKEAQEGGWTTKAKAIAGGAKKIADKYVGDYQDTLYFQKFNTDPRSSRVLWGQYMQNISAPLTEGRNTRKSYASEGALEEAYVFKIPVYGGMSSKPYADPASGKSYYSPSASTGYTGSSSSATGTIYRVRCGVYSVKSNAEALVTKLQNAGFDGFMESKNSSYYVYAGSFSSESNANALVTKLKAAGFDTAIEKIEGTTSSAKTYTLQYNANGGSGTMANTVVTYGVSTALRTSTFTRKGYTQTGWYRYRTSDNKWYYTSADGSTSAWYVEGSQPSGYTKNVMQTTSKVSKTSAVDGDIVILYAVWTPNHFTVQYNANGGSGTMADTTVTYGVSTSLRTTAFTKKGYTQTGWYRYRTSDNKWYYTSADGSTSAWYVEGEQPSGYKKNVMSVTSSVSKTSSVNGDVVVLYAVWTPNQYTLRYNANGGSGTMADTTVTYGVSTSLRTAAFTKKGYTQTGWYRYRKSDNKWYYTSADGSTSAWYVEGKQPSGYTKNVMNTTSSVSKTSAVDGDVVILYAVWTPNHFTLKYNANGGKGTMANTTVTYGVSTALRTSTFTRSGYTQTGWYRYRTSDNKWYYTSADGSTSAWYVEGKQPSGYKKNVMKTATSVSKTSAVDGDIVILYAVWTKNASTTTTTSSSVTYRVRCGVYSVKSNAQALVTDLTNDGFSAYLEVSGSNYNVYAGEYSVKANAENQVAKLKAAGFDAVIETVKA